jgi:hypothetical protein
MRRLIAQPMSEHRVPGVLGTQLPATIGEWVSAIPMVVSGHYIGSDWICLGIADDAR